MGACAIHGATRDCDGDETDIPQIAAGQCHLAPVPLSFCLRFFCRRGFNVFSHQYMFSDMCCRPRGDWRLPWVNPGLATFLFATVAVSCHDDDRMCGAISGGAQEKKNFLDRRGRRLTSSNALFLRKSSEIWNCFALLS